MSDSTSFAPGWPGIEPRWTSGAKSAIGTLVGDGACVWFTASHGILNEIHDQELDTARTREAGFLVSAADGFFSEEKRHASHAVGWMAPGVPAFRFFNTCTARRYTIEKRVCCCPEFDVVLQHIRFTPLVGTLADYHRPSFCSTPMMWRGGGRWCAARRHSSSAMDRPPSRIDGKRTRDSRRSRSPSSSRHCSARRTSPNCRATRTPPATCARRRISGTPRSSGGRGPRVRRSHATSA